MTKGREMSRNANPDDLHAQMRLGAAADVLRDAGLGETDTRTALAQLALAETPDDVWLALLPHLSGQAAVEHREIQFDLTEVLFAPDGASLDPAGE
jgi:hypothetical protein